SFRKMMLAMIGDIRVILVKLADRLHNMQTLDALPPQKRARIGRETLEIYAPIANRLGINSLKNELEDLGFKNTYPFRAKIIESTLKKAQGNQRQFVRKISDKLRDALSDAEIQVNVYGRRKHLFSIYRKMKEKKRSLSEIVDVFGFRLIVDDVDTCYRTLGIVHSLYKPMPGRFKDYIAIPRVNGYQSLHTTLFGINGIPIEVQIRTRDMDLIAESGVASHWQYKAVDSSVISPQARAREWLQSISEMQSAASSEEFMENVKVDLFPDKVYVFTPRGDILRLPRGSTCVDFAYAVHTGIGNHCVAAKIDRRLVPLRTAVKNGQTIDIVTSKRAQPNAVWVNFVVTAKARYSIRQYLKNLRRNEAIELGRRLLTQALSNAGSSMRKVSRARMKSVLREFELRKTVELYEQLGVGERLAPLVAQMLLQDDNREKHPDSPAPTSIAVAGTEGMVVSYARCCHPLPGDHIMGYMSSGRGIVIHRNKCGNLSQYSKEPNKWIPMHWSEELDRDFSTEIRVEAEHKPGVLAEVAARIAKTNSNIEQVSIDETEKDFVELRFNLLVKDRTNLAKVLRKIRTMSNVRRVSRSCA
ncbi:MAG: bifunctional (p)ppGpp synthetase/guanosine-3',5'-bis(diphosphate) 3'-pyrophosphohydrolase, partial [Gammaproteobacteria bacterium]|nr:bifunctional (p)ppGpp synthetase/guanosine-3',5'-bis(diphosphate) 3'-pyrophosphohydrolase [Gammaproteobacteria bacterium]